MSFPSTEATYTLTIQTYEQVMRAIQNCLEVRNFETAVELLDATAALVGSYNLQNNTRN